MKLFINATSARLGGGQTYLINLAKHIEKNQFEKVYYTGPDNLVLENSLRLDIPKIIVVNPFIRFFWELIVLPIWLKKLKIDVLFCPGGTIPMFIPRKVKVVTTFQNMMPFDHAQRQLYSFGYRKFRNWILEKQLLKSMMNSDLVIFISHFAKNVILERSFGNIKKYVVIPHGIHEAFKSQLSEDGNLSKDEKYFLYVSIFDDYKCQLEVVQSYKLFLDKVKKPDIPKLMLIGPHYEEEYGQKVRRYIQDNQLEDYIHVKNGVPHEELPQYYQRAFVNIFASLTENCPFILLESMASGRPLFSSVREPMKELAGEGALFFEPTKPDQLADLMEKVLDNTSLVDSMVINAKNSSQKYDWKIAAKKTWDEICELGN